MKRAFWDLRVGKDKIFKRCATSFRASVPSSDMFPILAYIYVAYAIDTQIGKKHLQTPISKE